MRGDDRSAEGFFSYVRLEERIPADHPLRRIRALVDATLSELSPVFDELYARDGRPSIPPERLLRGLLLQAFYTVRSERQLMEQLDFNLLFRWFVGLSIDDPVWDATVFCKNRDRLLAGDVARKFLIGVLNQPQVRRLTSGEHFSVDGTLIEAWASMKSFVARDTGDKEPPSGQGDDGSGGRNRERDFHGEKRTNQTHASTTDPDARLFRKGKGKEAKLCYIGHLLSENRNGLIVDACLTEATGTAERSAALAMIEESTRPRSTVGADKNYDTTDFVAGCRERGCTPHVAQNNTNRRSAIDRRTTRHAGYAVSQVIRKRIEESIGWMKTVAPPAQDPSSRSRLGRVALRPHGCGLQSRPHSKASRRHRMSLSGGSKTRQQQAEIHPAAGQPSSARLLPLRRLSSDALSQPRFSAAC